MPDATRSFRLFVDDKVCKSRQDRSVHMEDEFKIFSSIRLTGHARYFLEIVGHSNAAGPAACYQDGRVLES